MEGEIKKSGLNKRVKIPQKCMMWEDRRGKVVIQCFSPIY